MSPAHNQQIVLRGDLQFLLGKPGHRDGNAVMIFINQLNVIRWIATVTLALASLKGVKQAIKTDRGTVQRGKIKVAHKTAS